MAYSKQTWTNGPDGGTPLSAARLNHIEDGIEAAAQTADAALPATGGTVSGDLDVTGALTRASLSVAPMSLPFRPAWRDATTSYLMQSGHGWVVGGAGTSTSDANDTTDFVKGTQSIRVTTAANGIQSNIRKTGLDAMDLTGKMIRLVFKVDDTTHLERVRFYVGSGGFANLFMWNVHVHLDGRLNYVQSGEWVTVQVQWADVALAEGDDYSISANGEPSTTSGFTDLQFAVYDDGEGAVTYHLQSVEIVPDTTTDYASGLVSITFDDSWKSQYTLARPKMDALGYRGTMYTIADRVGSGPERCTLADLRSVQNLSGWEIAGHAYTAANHDLPNAFADLTAEELDAELWGLKSWLASNGFPSDSFAYPQGRYDKTTDGVAIDEIAAQYWATSRSIVSETQEVSVPAMPQRIKAMSGISEAAGGTSPDIVTGDGGVLDRCQRSGGWLILVFHQITASTPDDALGISQAGFDAVMDGIKSRGIPVLPVGDVIQANR